MLFISCVYFLFLMNIIHSSLDKQTTATQESDPGGVLCSGNISYGKVNIKGNGFKYGVDGKDDTYDYI